MSFSGARGIRYVAAHLREASCVPSGPVKADALPDDFPVRHVFLRLARRAAGRTRRHDRTGKRRVAPSYAQGPLGALLPLPGQVLEQIAAWCAIWDSTR
jgi:hypothetical protein